MTNGAHRKVVTVLFCDVVGSTSLGESVDPEALQGLLSRYFERMKGIVESHGGSVEKFIGDAVMAVFGVPVAHEDDALRACRAAVEMRDALPELGVEARIGVNSGEVLTGTEERLATGDAVNVAARLEQAAQAGELLIGAATLELVGEAVGVGDERLLELKGKADPVAAYPLVSLHDAAERSHAARFVGRERELAQLVDAWEAALAGQGCELVTVVGDPGVGKSRLVAEALARIEARAVRGRCLAYGEGITYWPVVEVAKELDALPEDELASAAIRSLLGESDAVSGTDEIAWAFRKLLEEQAPLVVCFDDIQWGEETFLDLVESTGLLSMGAPLLLICIARPELLERRPAWPATLSLEPLPTAEVGVLIGDSVSPEVRERIVRASGGNPLFVTEMLALAGDDADIEVPATLRALLAARLDQLDQAERSVLERSAVEGELFHRGAVQALAPEETEVTPRLASLVRRGLVRPDRPMLPREEAYRFRHLLIRDAAYEALPKATRADLHRRFAAWLEQRGEDLVELDEILGYHLEQAADYLDELGRPDPELVLSAGARLADAARRALWRGDRMAARTLLTRSLDLTRPYRFDVHLELDLCRVVHPDLRISVASAAAERAKKEGDEAAALLAGTVATYGRLDRAEASVDELEEVARAALPLLEAADDHRGLVHVWFALGAGVANSHCRFDEFARAAEQAILHARADGPDIRLFGLPEALVFGPRPAGEALATLETYLSEHPEPTAERRRAVLLAMLDRLDDARALAVAAYERQREIDPSATPLGIADVARIAGDYELAAKNYRAVWERTEEIGELSFTATNAPEEGRALCALGRYEEAEQLARKGRELSASDDIRSQGLWRQVEAMVLARRGEAGEARRLAGEAVALVEETDSLPAQGDAYADLAEVLEAVGLRDEAIAAWQDALERYERKGIVPLARRVRERLAALEPA